MTTAIPRLSPLFPSEIEEDRVQEGGIIVERQILLLPETENAPAKIKDPGVVNLAKKGAVAYNSKSQELLFLPFAERERRRLASRLRESLFDESGLQPIDCGNDAAVFSLSERYVREWGAAARFFSEERGREVHLLGWCETAEEATTAAERIKRTIREETSMFGLSFVEETDEDGIVCSVLLSPAAPGSLGGRPGFVCNGCGRILLPDSPVEFRAIQPGADEEEEVLEDISTPGASTILELCRQLDIGVERTIKAMLYVALDEDRRVHPVAAFLRGDFNVSMNKLSAWLCREKNFVALRTAEKQELQDLIGEVAGYCGPVGMPENVVVVCDASVKGARNTVVGANRPGFHRKGCCHGRDFDYPLADIVQNTEGMPCPCGEGTLTEATVRDSGRIAFSDLRLKNRGPEEGGKHRTLVCRSREGVTEYPVELRGVFSLENILLAAHS